MKNIKLLLPLALILSFMVACTQTNDTDRVKDTIGQTTQEASGTVYEDLKLTFLDAFNIYMDKYPDTKVKKLELERDYGEYVYEVEGYDANKEYEIKINSVSGQIIKEKSEADDDDHKGELTKDHAKLVEDIIRKALAEAGEGAIIKEVTVKDKKGGVEVEVEIDTKGAGEIEYKYDMDGTLLEIDQ